MIYLPNMKSDINAYDDTSTPNVIYIGEETELGGWLITKFDKTAKTFTYAGIDNNNTYKTFSTAWAARTSLVYVNFGDL